MPTAEEGEGSAQEFNGMSLNIQIYTTFLFMDLEQDHSTAPWTTIFHPIHTLPPSLLQQQSCLLKNSFSLAPHPHHADFTLALFPKALLLSSLFLGEEQCLGYVQVSFDLKFEIIYESEKNIKSAKKGLRFLYDKTRTFTLYSTSPIVQAWNICLASHLNQLGFHQLFRPLKKLGRGNFASVYEVERVTDRRRFAVKAFSKQNCFSAKNGKQSLMNELCIVRRLSRQNHPNLLRLQGVYQSQNSIYVVQEVLGGGQLLHRIKERNGYFSEEEVREVMFGVLSGVEVMHRERVMHRDLKPENIMLRSSGSMSPVIVDYGLATHADQDNYLFFRCGTPGYVAPEIIALTQNQRIEPICDIFSLGAIFHILLTRKPLFEGTQYEEVYRKNKEMKFTLQGAIYQGVDALAMSLLKSMLLADPKERITAVDALNHPYLNGYSQQEKVSSPVATCGGGVVRREWGHA